MLHIVTLSYTHQSQTDIFKGTGISIYKGLNMFTETPIIIALFVIFIAVIAALLFSLLNKKRDIKHLDIQKLNKTILVSGTDGCGMTGFAESISKNDCTIISLNDLDYTNYRKNLLNEINSYLIHEKYKPLIIERCDVLFKDNTDDIKHLLLQISKGSIPVIFRTQEFSLAFRVVFGGYFDHIYLGKTICDTDWLAEPRRKLEIGEVLDINGCKVNYIACEFDGSHKNTLHINSNSPL
jgi:hypothetical protein